MDNKKKVIGKEPESPQEDNKNELQAFCSDNNKVDVDIEPDVKSNNVNLQMCTCSFIINCFSPKKDE
jgi:hypothetical protein